MLESQMEFETEVDLVESLCRALLLGAGPWGIMQVRREFDYVRGRVDVVGVDISGRVVALEAKLSDWRRGLQQAYRNTCFAHTSFVVLPLSREAQTVRHIREFRRRSVGLCFVSVESISVPVVASDCQPLLPRLTERARDWVRAEVEREPCDKY